MGHLLSSSMVGLMVTSYKKSYATCCVTQICSNQSPWPWDRLLLNHASTGDSDTLKGRSGSVSVGALGPGAQGFIWALQAYLAGIGFDSKHDCAPPIILWGFSFALGHTVLFFFFFFYGIQHSPVDGCSAASCNFGVLIGEDECMSFYYAILFPVWKGKKIWHWKMDFPAG